MSGSLAWPIGVGEMPSRIRELHWSQTPLGAIATWTERCRNTVDMVLAIGFPAIVLVGPDLIQIYNDPYRELMGDKHPAGLGQPTRDCWPEVWHLNAPIYERVFAGETVTIADAHRPVARFGMVDDAWFTLSYSPLRDRNGAVTDILVTVFETTDRVLAQNKQRDSEERLRLAISATRLGIFDWDLTNDTVAVNEWYREMFGLGLGLDEAVVAESIIANIIHADDRDFVRARIAEALDPAGSGRYGFEHRVETANGLRWVLTSAEAQFVGEGTERRAVRFIGNDLDVTERHEREQALRDSEASLRVMVAELQHRTRNLIGIVGTIARRLLASSSSLEDFGNRFAARLEALSRVQSLLSETSEGRITLADIVRMELEALGADLDDERITIEGEAVALRRSTVQMLSLAIHELATNARKYGALRRDDGRLIVHWATCVAEAGARRLRFTWTETGIDPQVEETEGPLHRGGYGRELIEQALPYALKARADYILGTDRLDCTIDLPLDR